MHHMQRYQLAHGCIKLSESEMDSQGRPLGCWLLLLHEPRKFALSC